MSTATALQPDIDERLYRIGEVSRLSNLKPFVLRYWETEFPMLEPVKSPSGHRMYRQQDVDMVFKIKRLLYDEGFTIAGARRLLREGNGAIGVEPSARAAAAGTHSTDADTAAHGPSDHAHHSDALDSDANGSAAYTSHGTHAAATHAPRASSENAAEM